MGVSRQNRINDGLTARRILCGKVFFFRPAGFKRLNKGGTAIESVFDINYLESENFLDFIHTVEFLPCEEFHLKVEFLMIETLKMFHHASRSCAPCVRKLPFQGTLADEGSTDAL